MFNDHNIFSNNIYDAANKLRQIQEAQLYSANQMIGIGRPMAASRMRRQDTRELANIIDATKGLSPEDMKRMYNVTPEDIEAFTRVHADIVGEGPGKKLMPVPGSPSVRDAERKAYEADVNFAKVFGGTHPEEGRAMAPHLRRTLAWLSTRPHRKDMTPNVFKDLNADGKVSAREVVSAQQQNQFTGKIEEQQNKFNKTLLNEAPRSGGRQTIMPGSMPSIMQQLGIQDTQNQMPMPNSSGNQTQRIIPSGGMENVGRNLSYVPPQMEPNYLQPGNNPPQPQEWSVTNSGPGVRQGIPGVNVEGPAVPQYVPRQMEPNYVQPGNNPAQPQEWSVATAGKGTTPNQFAQMAGGIMKALDDVRRGIPPQAQQQVQQRQQQQQQQQQTQPSQKVTSDSEIEDYLKGAGKESFINPDVFFNAFNNTKAIPAQGAQIPNKPTPAEFNQAAMEPGGVYQMDKSGYVQSYLPAKQQTQNVAPARVKQQPAQQQSDNYQPVAGEYWKSPTERVVPQQTAPTQPAPQQGNQQASQQSTRDAMAQYGAQQFAQNATNLAFGGIFNNPQQQATQATQAPQKAQQQKPSPSTPFFQRAGETSEEIEQYQQQNQTWGPFGMRGQSPQEMEEYNRQVNSRRK